MKVLFALTFVSFLSSISFASAQFKSGNDISIKEMSGDVTYYCQDDMGKQYTRFWNCYAAEINPGTHDYLVTTTPVDADKVTLTSTHSDGSTKSKNASFDGKNSTSTSRFNLLVSSLTQRPLLKVGNNVVAYQLTKGSKVVEAGTFQSTVNVLESKQCRHRSEFAYHSNVCEFQSFGCDRYFYMENNCNY